ncbi:MAG TPA: hypothetical protein VMU82_15895 [Acetobacteraceae bacterium]|nr:hypothetical protein [Acetobacteraceae bacterium]
MNARATTLLACLLAGCTAPPPAPRDAAQAVYEAEAAYAAALSVAVQYRALPACGTDAPAVCANPAVLAQLRQADATAWAALRTAQTLVQAGGDHPTSLAAAQTAVAAFATLIATFGTRK